MKTRIIIEGADQQGKSEFCKLLLEMLSDKWSIKHFGMPDENFDFHLDYKTDEYVISDRSFFSEAVYGAVLGRKCRISKYAMDDLLRYCEEHTVVFLVDRNDQFEFDITRKEEYDLDTILNVRNAYDIYFSVLKIIDKIFIDMGEIDNLKPYLKYILDTRLEPSNKI